MEKGTGTGAPEVQEGKRRRLTLDQNKALLREAEQPGQSISEVGQRYGIAPSMLFGSNGGYIKALKQKLKPVYVAMELLSVAMTQSIPVSR